MINTVIQLFDLFDSNLTLLAWIIDLLAKSFLLVVVIRYLEQNYAQPISSNHKHKLWLTAVILLGLLPISSSLTVPFFNRLLPESNLSLITVLLPTNLIIDSGQSLDRPNSWAAVAIAGYLSGLVFLLTKLGLSFVRVHHIKRTTNYHNPGRVIALLNRLRNELGISQRVNIGCNEFICSPMTFGLKNPIIILPEDSKYWDISLLESALIHELSHIKRRDWLTFILAYLIASFNWFNPFVWQSLNRLSLQAEFSCDNAVLNSGKPRKEFAEQILAIAKKGLGLERSELLTQSIVGNGELTLRIENILYQSSRAHSRWLSFALISLCIVPAAFVAISAGNIFAIEDESDYPSENLRLIYSESPLYPDTAFENGVQGFTQFSFTVDENGEIAPQSINLVLSEPRYLFEEASLAALNSFKFVPQKVRGKTIPTAGVRYTFKYNLGI